ncbi:MAG: hypothetical protein JKY34_07025, partial [Kordiimonadaceae bacterium]|nr:hypothetical protein [Kordiimonadaceae bacterium]
MPLEVQNIFNSLLEWPQRGTGSEDEMMAREQLVTHLEGEPGVDTVEEAFLAPATALPFFAVVAAGQVFAMWAASSMALIALLAGGTFFVSYFLFVDGRISPLVWLTPKKITANLVAKKGEGRRLFILMAHLDSAPASYAHRPDQIKKHIVYKYLAVGASGLGVLIPVLALNDVSLPDVPLGLLSVFVFALFLFAG